MLDCKFIDNSPILEVKQVSMSFTDTKVQYWYYDTENWLRSLLGQKDEKPTQPMTQKEIDWASKNYIPKAFKEKVAA